AKTVNKEVQLQALVDGNKIIITKSTVRRDLQLEDAEGVDYLPNATIFEQLTLMGPKTTAWNEFSSNIASAIICLATSQEFNFSKLIFENEAVNEEMDDSLVRAATTASSLEAEQDSGSGLRCQETIKDTITQTRFENVSKTSNDSLLTGVNTPRSDEDSLKLKELMEFCTKFQQRVLDLENIKTAQAQEIISLKLKVKKLEKKGGLRTHKLKRLYKVGRFARVISSNEASLGNQEDASKQGRQIDDIDKDAEITLVNETQGRYGDEEMFDTGVLDDEEVFAGHDMAEKVVNVAKKEVSTADPVTTAGEVVTVSAATITEDEITLAQALAELKSVKPKVTTATTATTKGILFQEPSESITITTIPLKDKGKGIMVEEPLKMKKKDQISFDEQEAIRLQAEFDEEVRLAREKDEANVALIEEWNDIQAKIDVDYQLAQRLQAQEQEELTIEERAKLFQQLLEKRRKHFAAKRAEEKRNRPPTKAQQRSIMCTYLKNMAGWKPKDLNNKSFDSIKKLFDKAMKWVNTFVDIRYRVGERKFKESWCRDGTRE
ncbi:hypothetical protein Tco_1065422, partial [Tanacetum coccineum]